MYKQDLALNYYQGLVDMPLNLTSSNRFTDLKTFQQQKYGVHRFHI